MEYSIQEVARAAATTSRTLRHYDSIGLVTPSRVGHNGYRYYDDRALVRLQRVLLLRELGLGLDRIAEVLAAQDEAATAAPATAHAGAASHGESPGETASEAAILAAHRDLLVRERDRVSRQIAAVERTISALSTPEHDTLLEVHMFDGFDHTAHRDEVIERWGSGAYETSDAWWRTLSKTEQGDWMSDVQALNSAWIAAHTAGAAASSPEAQQLAARHIDWLRSVPGTPAGDAFTPYVQGLGEMYVADDRFAANYGGTAGARFVRDALAHYVATAAR